MPEVTHFFLNPDSQHSEASHLYKRTGCCDVSVMGTGLLVHAICLNLFTPPTSLISISVTALTQGCCLSSPTTTPTLQLPLLASLDPDFHPACCFSSSSVLAPGRLERRFCRQLRNSLCVLPEFRLTLMLVSDPSLMQRNV